MDSRPRLLVTGGSSFLGRRLVPLAAQKWAVQYTYFSSNPLNLPTGRSLDLRDVRSTHEVFEAWQPQVVIHLAGSNRSPDMDAVIRQGTAHVCAAARATGSRLVFLSTDVVFDGRCGPYAETDQPRPLHDYGRAKVAAEAVVRTVPDHVIVRTSLIYDLVNVADHIAWVIAALQKGEPATLFTDQWRNPIWTMNLSQALLELAASPYRGVLHVAGRQALTRSEFGLAQLDWWGINQRDTLVLAPGDGSRWPADCRLDTRRAQRLLETPLLGVEEVLPTARLDQAS